MMESLTAILTTREAQDDFLQEGPAIRIEFCRSSAVRRGQTSKSLAWGLETKQVYWSCSVLRCPVNLRNGTLVSVLTEVDIHSLTHKTSQKMLTQGKNQSSLQCGPSSLSIPLPLQSPSGGRAYSQDSHQFLGLYNGHGGGWGANEELLGGLGLP